MPSSSDLVTLLRWELTPFSRRKPATQRELAVLLKTTESALSHWKHLSSYKRLLQPATLARAERALPDVIEALIKSASAPSGAKDRETFVKILLPALNLARQNGYFDEWEAAIMPAGKKIRLEAVTEKMAVLPADQRTLFLETLEVVGLLAEGEKTEEALPDVLEVELLDEDIIDLAVQDEYPLASRRGSRHARKVLPAMKDDDIDLLSEAGYGTETETD